MAEPELLGPEGVCLTGEFTFVPYRAGGDPATDQYFWSITDDTGFEIANLRGENVEIPITTTGTFDITVRVARGGNPNYATLTETLVVERGPAFIMPPDVILCGNEEVTVTALDPNVPNNENFNVEWQDVNATPVGTGNTFTTNVPGRYFAIASSAFCTAVGSTFIGPSIEVEVAASATTACLGETVTYTPNSPITATWSYQRADQNTRTELGNFFELSLQTNDLEGIGQYTIFFNAADPQRPDCNVEHSFPLDVRENASFSLIKLNDADGCENPTGLFQIRAITALETITVSGVVGASFNNVNPGDILEVPNLEPQVYTVTGLFNGCTVTQSIIIENINPDEAIPFTATSTDQTCSGTGIVPGTITIDFGGVSQSGEYRIIGSEGDVFDGNFANEQSITVDLPADVYTIEIGDGECVSVSRDRYTVEGSGQVNFSIPAAITACEVYDLIPQSGQVLRYELTYPDGSVVNADAGEAFTLTASGSYEMLAVSTDPDSPLCPRTRSFELEINEQLTFDVSQRQIDCLGNQLFTAELMGMTQSDVIIRWLDENNTIWGRELQFFPPAFGTFYLSVQPRAGSACPAAPIQFEVSPIVLTAEVEIEGTPFCGLEPFTTLSVNADMDLVELIEWFYTDADGNYTHLLDFDNQTSIDITDEGTYEVIIRNEINCKLGRDTFEVVRLDNISLELDAIYYVCVEDNIYPNINPGTFESYTWLSEGTEVSTAPSYIPQTPGSYELLVVDANGCEASTQFEVEGVCFDLISYPNALIPGNPQKDFRIFADPNITEVEVFIFNRSGELIFHCQSPNSPDTSPICIWDGMLNGRKLLVGTYPIIVKYRSTKLDLNNEERNYIIVPQ